MNKTLFLSLFLFTTISQGATTTCLSQISMLAQKVLPEVLAESAPYIQKLAREREKALHKNLMESVSRVCGDTIEDCGPEMLRRAVVEALNRTTQTKTGWQLFLEKGKKYVYFSAGMVAYISVMSSEHVSKEVAIGVTLLLGDILRNMTSLVMEPFNAANRARMIKQGGNVLMREMKQFVQEHYHATYWRSQGLNDLTVTGQYREQMLVPQFMTSMKTASSLLQAQGEAALPRVADLLVTEAWDFFEHYPDIDVTFIRFREMAQSLLGRHDLNHTMALWPKWIDARDKALERLINTHYEEKAQLGAIQGLVHILDSWLPPPL